MHVVITGCGRTGRALATRLDAEGDTVTVIELDDTVERGLPAGFRGLVPGNGFHPRVLEAAGIAHAEAFVALTPNDSANIVSARVARDVYRVPHVVARLHDPAHAELYTEFGIATVGSVPTIVNRLIQVLHHRTLEPHQTFGNGETLLVRSSIPAYLAGRRVAEFNVPGEIGVVELSRRGHSSIPEPSAPLADGDVLSFIVAAASLGRLRSFLGGEVVVMRIIVVGGTGLAEQVADALHRAGDEVTVIDTEPGREPALAKAGLRAVYGDILVLSTLEAAGALRADVLVACTQSDEDNLVISFLAKKRFNVPRVIARVNDPANDELFSQSWGVDALISPATSLVSMIRRVS